ncbi:MAG: MFS transporter [Polyangiaceae bacterium]|nr:MFS transporter [Polyangiaceae bacterium]
MPTWLSELLPIAILLAVVVLVLVRLPKVKEIEHSKEYRRRRVLNWLPLGLAYAFLYMGRYNLTVSKRVFEHLTNSAGEQLMTSADFGSIFGIGAAVYGCAFLINGPITDKFGGRKAILISAGGAAIANALMAAATWTVCYQLPGAATIANNFFPIFSILFGANMYFQSFGAVAIVKVNAPWFHVRERGVFGAIFGILISLGIYFAYDWSFKILSFFGQDPKLHDAVPRLPWVFGAPAVLLIILWILVYASVRNTPGEAGHKDFDPGDASSGDDGPALGAVKVFALMFRNPVIMTIACIEFCSGFLRQAIMQWYGTFAKHTNDILGNADGFVNQNWGLLLCIAGILGGMFAGVISDHLFQSRRGPVASILYGGMLAGAIVLLFTYTSAAVGWIAVVMSVFVIGVHGMLSGTASMDFGGKKNVGVAVGLIDGFVYAGTAAMAILYGQILPKEELNEAGKIVGPTTDPANWIAWPAAMIPVAIIGLVLATRVWNAKPAPKKPAPKPATAS